MARSRNIKPGFFHNEELVEIAPEGRLLFIGLWLLADREGRLEDRPKRIKAQIFPYDLVDVADFLSQLEQRGFLSCYENSGRKYIQILNWKKHQNPHHKEVGSTIPAPDQHKDTVCEGYIPLSNTIRQRIFERDGKICACCGATEKLEIDHILPVSKGGNSVDGNLQVLCKPCNIKKGTKTIDYSCKDDL